MNFYLVYDKSVEFAGKCYNVYIYTKEGTWSLYQNENERVQGPSK